MTGCVRPSVRYGNYLLILTSIESGQCGENVENVVPIQTRIRQIDFGDVGTKADQPSWRKITGAGKGRACEE